MKKIKVTKSNGEIVTFEDISDIEYHDGIIFLEGYDVIDKDGKDEYVDVRVVDLIRNIKVIITVRTK